jgi:hypothetical protein
MNRQFERFFQDFVTQNTSGVFDDAQRCKSLLLDQAKNEYKKEIRLLLQALELGFHTAILHSNDLNLTRMTLIRQFHDEYAIDEEAAVSLVDMLLWVLKGRGSGSAGHEDAAMAEGGSLAPGSPAGETGRAYDEQELQHGLMAGSFYMALKGGKSGSAGHEDAAMAEGGTFTKGSSPVVFDKAGIQSDIDTCEREIKEQQKNIERITQDFKTYLINNGSYYGEDLFNILMGDSNVKERLGLSAYEARIGSLKARLADLRKKMARSEGILSGSSRRGSSGPGYGYGLRLI